MKKLKLYTFQSKGKWYFHIKSRNGKIVMQSEGYNTKQALLKTVNLVFESVIILA